MPCGPCQAAKSRQKASAAACAVCGYSVGIDPVECRYASEGVQVALRVRGQSCPDGRFPDEAGLMRWLGCRWYGVPYPVRVWLWLRHPRHPRPSSFAGCGCLVRLKSAMRRVWIEVNR